MATRPVIEAGDCTVSGSNTASTSWAVSYPNAASGDLLTFNVAWDDSTATTACTAPAGPNGEVAHSIAGPVASASTEVRCQAWYYIATGTWTASTLTFTPNASESWSATVIKVLAGEFDPNTPIGASETAASAGTAETSVASPAFTAGSTDSDGCLVWFAAVDSDPLSATNPTGWTIRQRQDLGDVAHGIATRDSAVTNSESISAGAWTITSDSWASIAYVVRAPSRTYYVVYPSAESAPSATQIKAGQRSSGAAATASGNEASRSTTGEEVFASAATGLTGGTSYKVSLVVNGSGGDGSVSTTAAWVTDTVAALTGSAATASAGTAGVTHTQAASGSAVTASAGTLTALAEYSAALTGAAATASAGTVSPVNAAALSGSGVTVSVGTVAGERTVAASGSEVTTAAGTVTAGSETVAELAGVEVTALAGDLAIAQSAGLLGAEAMTAAGSLTADTALAITGDEAAAAAGSVTAGPSAPLSGSEVESAAGSVATGSSVTLAGAEVTVDAGTISTVTDSSASLAGSSATASAGAVAPVSSAALTGAEVSTAAGTLSVSIGEDVSLELTGAAATCSAGSVGAGSALGLSGEAATTTAGTVGGYVDLGLTGIAVAGLIGQIYVGERLLIDIPHTRRIGPRVVSIGAARVGEERIAVSDERVGPHALSFGTSRVGMPRISFDTARVGSRRMQFGARRVGPRTLKGD